MKENETKTLTMPTKDGPIRIEVSLGEERLESGEAVLTLAFQANAAVQAVTLPISVMRMVAGLIYGFEYVPPVILVPAKGGLRS